MSLRGFKRDHTATEAAHFSDTRSFVSLPKIIVGECTEPKPHLVLYGKDIGPMRALIFQLDREKNGGANRCWKCGQIVFEDAPEGAHYRGEWHHRRNKSGQRCDDPGNAAVSCGACHRPEHVQVRLRSGKIMQAHDEFP